MPMLHMCGSTQSQQPPIRMQLCTVFPGRRTRKRVSVMGGDRVRGGTGRLGPSALSSDPHAQDDGGRFIVSGWLKFGSLGLSALLLVSAVSVALVEGGGFLNGLWLAANTVFTTGFSPGPESEAGRVVLMGTMLLMAPLWLVTLVGVVETAAWRLEQRRLTESRSRRDRSPSSHGRR